jgi:hypothetical protein
MFFTISVIVNVFPVSAAGLAAAWASWNINKRPSALLPRRLVRIVTVNPSKSVLFD